MMTDLAIRVENLGKQYKIGESQERYRTLRDTLVEGMRAPIRKLSPGNRLASPGRSRWSRA